MIKLILIIVCFLLFLLLLKRDAEIFREENKAEEIRKEKKKVTIENAFVLEKTDTAVRYFAKGRDHICYIEPEVSEAVNAVGLRSEELADLFFEDDRLVRVLPKKERISGKLLSCGGGRLELEGIGTYEIAENCAVYKLYGVLEEMDLSGLPIGYDYADFCVYEGKICGVLLVKKENMQQIRVAVSDTDYRSLYQEKICLTADCDCKITYGSYADRKTERLLQGESLELTAESPYLQGDRMMIEPEIHSGRITVASLKRQQGMPSYRGRLEVSKEKEGLLLINEVLLEEYLYSVVPSEMPSSYPAEALKAQAVCARTYAYRYLLDPGLPAIGAHVDDSVSYQVYNNIAEVADSTRAVRSTEGEILFYREEPIRAYYYSTSCGFRTDAESWKPEKGGEDTYLSAMHISREMPDPEDSSDLPEQMREEEAFREYIMSRNPEDLEAGEGWYRWTYHVEKLDVERLAKACGRSFTKVYDLKIKERGAGGVATQLYLETDEGTVEIETEYRIREVLNQGGTIVKQKEENSSGKQEDVPCGVLLPSAYLIIDVEKKDECVIGYTIIGGGYGHGVGMSQNGAKNLGKQGKPYREILAFFYPESDLVSLY